MAGGARLKRLAHDMALDLDRESDDEPARLPEGFRLVGLSDAAKLAAASAASTPPGHPDRGFWPTLDARLKYWERLLAGELCGPILDATTEVHTISGLMAGAIIVTRTPASTGWQGGGWIPEVFLVPEHQRRSLGTFLVTRAIHQTRRQGEPRIGLTVTDANPAEHLYQRLGFRRIRSVYLLDVQSRA